MIWTAPTPVADAADTTSLISVDNVTTIIAALLAAAVAVIGYSVQQRAARRAQRASVYAEALRAVEDYLESPYLIHRRDGTPEHRRQITEHISSIKSRISYSCALLQLHAPQEVANAYEQYVRVAQLEAGPQMTAAWGTDPIAQDRDVPLGASLPRNQADTARRSAIVIMRADVGNGL